MEIVNIATHASEIMMLCDGRKIATPSFDLGTSGCHRYEPCTLPLRQVAVYAEDRVAYIAIVGPSLRFLRTSPKVILHTYIHALHSPMHLQQTNTHQVLVRQRVGWRYRPHSIVRLELAGRSHLQVSTSGNDLKTYDVRNSGHGLASNQHPLTALYMLHLSPCHAFAP